MRWGHRKADAISYQRKLNSLDKKSTHQSAKYMKADVKANRYARKGAKIISRHDTNPKKRDNQKLEKITNKMNKAINKRDRANTAFNSIDSETWKVMAKAAENNYRINGKQVLRNGERGQSYLNYALSGPIVNTAVNLFDHHIILVLIKLRISEPERLLIGINEQ